MPHVEQELLTLPEQLSSPPVFSGVRVAWSLVFCVMFIDRCSSFFFWPLHCLTSICGFWSPIWYLQTFLTAYKKWFWPSIHEYLLLPKVIVSFVSSFYPFIHSLDFLFEVYLIGSPHEFLISYDPRFWLAN